MAALKHLLANLAMSFTSSTWNRHRTILFSLVQQHLPMSFVGFAVLPTQFDG
jgi:hypothetical protein